MYRYSIQLLTVLLFATLALAQQKTATEHTATGLRTTSNVPTEETVNAFLQAMFGYEKPDLSWKVEKVKPSPARGLTEVDVRMQGQHGPQDLKFYVTEDGKHAIAGDLMPFGDHPFEPMKKEVQSAAFGPARGPATAPVTIVEFSDLECPHCKDMQPLLDKLMAEEKNVKLVFQNFPLPTHDWAKKAAGYADCVGRSSNDAFWKFIGSVYTQQTDITAANADQKLTALADQAGVKGSDMAACAAKPETEARVEKSIALGKSLDVNSTPTLFVNGRPIPGGPPYEVLKKLVDYSASEQAAK
jgi:protein-disulfide isomerase